MKAILTSIKPRHNKNICNHIKWWEIRKLFPLDYEGWVYIYNTKDTEHGYLTTAYVGDKLEFILSFSKHYKYYGKVIGRFWCDRVETIQCNWHYEAGNCYDPETFYEHDLLEKSCLTYNELNEYLNGKNGKAIHITNLEIFDKPKEIKEFYKVGYENSVTATKKYIFGSMNREERRKYKTEIDLKINNEIAVIKDNYKLTRAPQSWCYIEV